MEIIEAEPFSHQGLTFAELQFTTITLELLPEELERLRDLAETNDAGSDGYGNCGWQSPVMKALAEKIRSASGQPLP